MAGRGIRTIAFCHADFDVGGELPFRPLPIFHSSYYYVRGSDPVTSPAISRRELGAEFTRDLRRLRREMITAQDLLWIPSINQNHLYALLRWFAGFAPGEAPQCLITLLFPPGATVEGARVTVYDSLMALHYRRAFDLAARMRNRVHLTALGARLADDYSYLAQRPVPAQPLLVEVTQDFGPPTPKTALLFAGNADPRKGVLLLPELVTLLAERLPDWTFLIQANDDQDWLPKEPLDALRRLAPDLPSMKLRTGFVEDDEYRSMIERSQVVLLGYDAQAYRHQTSGILWEAIAAGRAVLVPAGASLEGEAAAWGASHRAIDTSSVQSIADGFVAALENGLLDAKAAERGAKSFRTQNGAGRFVDQLLALTGRE
jgi:glycosyltransferase involved in cell wall biosynthesis